MHSRSRPEYLCRCFGWFALFVSSAIPTDSILVTRCIVSCETAMSMRSVQVGKSMHAVFDCVADDGTLQVVGKLDAWHAYQHISYFVDRSRT